MIHALSSWHISSLRSVCLKASKLVVVLFTILSLLSNGHTQRLYAQSGVTTQAEDISNVVPNAGFIGITSSGSVAEGRTYQLSIILTPPMGESVQVKIVSVDGTATGGVDYGIINQTVTFGPYQTVKTLNVFVHQDTTQESDETFQVKVESVLTGNAIISQPDSVTITIQNVNAPPTSTPTNTPEPTATPTYTWTPTRTPTYTPTRTPTVTPTVTPTNTPKPTATPTYTWTPTRTPTSTSTPTRTYTPTYTPLVSTYTPTFTPTRTPTPMFTSTGTSIPTSTFTPTRTPTLMFTSTGTSIPTSTFTPTRTPTYTSTPTWTPSPVPPEGRDETDPDPCDQITPLSTDGFFEGGVFETQDQVNWFEVNVTGDTEYQITILVPENSTADVEIETRLNCVSEDDEFRSFSPGTILNFEAPSTGLIYLRLNNRDGNVFGSHVKYNIAIQEAVEEIRRATIIVAGQLKANDHVQDNIYKVANDVFKMFQEEDYPADDILYLAPDDFDSDTRAFRDDDATVSKLEWAIKTWARNKEPSVLNLYMVDHGEIDKFYLNNLTGQVLTPSVLDTWLDDLEAKVPGIKINIFIEACHSGSFIDDITGPERVIVTSTNENNVAYASRKSAYFSEYFLTALRSGDNIYESWRKSQDRIKSEFPGRIQEPWLDADGNGVPNQSSDFIQASMRGFNQARTLGDTLVPPEIVRGIPPSEIDGNKGFIGAEIGGDKSVDDVWAIVYPPSYQSPETGAELVAAEDLDIIYLNNKGNNIYEGAFNNFVENGIYRIVIHADDDDRLVAEPKVIEFEAGKLRTVPDTPTPEIQDSPTPEIQKTPTPEVQDSPAPEIQKTPVPDQRLYLPFVSQ